MGGTGGRRLAMAAACAAAVGASLAAAAGALEPQGSPDQQRPTFRTGVNFVRVDVFVRANGVPVSDLRAEDFLIQEDGVAQTISTFEHIVIRPGTPAAERVDPRNVRESIQMAGDPRNRLFVLFLDTFHVTDSGRVAQRPVAQPGEHRLPPSD